ncbi:alpha/beta fold hydrolase [Subtercola sp. PAMC28395]|uniref:alpha/beta fold hydrolase n=1 Tax=Subtercola sp. PAMC28395 TaxID=2846775 RepID=UPI00209AE9EC|nr:alpha/beta hydrolase [Subtercola sp. PAMC28395]
MTAEPSGVLTRNHVTLSGDESARPMIFAHGYGTSQRMWRLVAPMFAADHRVALFDHVGSGESDRAAYERSKYDSLHGYADDLLEIIRALDLHDVVYVGHSVGAMIGVIAAIAEPERFGTLVLVGPSPRYINDTGYVGGFEADDVDALLDSLDANHLGWAAAMAPVFMGNAERPELAAELNESFANTDPVVAEHFARVTFLSDHRHDVGALSVPTLIVNSADDFVAPVVVGEYLREKISGSTLVVLDEGGHYLHLSNPAALHATIRGYLHGTTP